MYLIHLMYKVFIINRRFIFAYILNTVIIVLFYFLLSSSMEVVYPLTISIFILFIYLIVEGFKFNKFTSDLTEARRSPDYNNNSSQMDYKLIFDTINNIHGNYIDKIYKINCDNKARNTLYSQWIHNMKTSITIIDLACERLTNESTCSIDYLQDIIEENSKLKVNLEECLNILRLDDFARDYMPEKSNLRQIVYNVVNSKKRDFIYRGVHPSVNVDDTLEIYTDKKWCSYIIEQIIANAIKYSDCNKNKKVYISAEVESQIIRLIIKDEGIGMDREDLSRVFNPFFTGSNGRQDRNATGIGMYMVKTICDKLEHKVNINSQKGEGTEVILCFLSKM